MSAKICIFATDRITEAHIKALHVLIKAATSEILASQPKTIKALLDYFKVNY